MTATNTKNHGRITKEHIISNEFMLAGETDLIEEDRQWRK